MAHNTLWNLAASLTPVVVGAIAVPLLIRGIGADRFGVLSIAWIVLGYMGLLDLGLGRALTKAVAERVGAPDEVSIVPIVWSSLLLLFLLGIFGASITYIVSPWLVFKALKIPVALQEETLRGFLLLGASVPITMLTSGLRGLLEALQRFRVLSLIRVPLTVFSFAAPLLVLPLSHSLVSLFAVLVAGRVVGCAAHFVACLRAMPALKQNFALEPHLMPALLKVGGWMTLSNLLGPALIYADRFLIGGLLSLTALTFYTAPFDMLTRLWLIPAALISVLFPAFTATFKHEPNRVGVLLARGIKYVLLATFPAILIIVTLSPEILRIWLGSVFAQNSAQTLRWLAAGIFLNCLAQVPFTLIQSAGRPDVTAKMALVEIPFYWLAVWFMTGHFGIIGTAAAWAVRSLCELSFLFFYAIRLLPQAPAFTNRFAAATVAALTIFYCAGLPGDGQSKTLFLVGTLVPFAFVSWRWGLSTTERLLLSGWLRINIGYRSRR